MNFLFPLLSALHIPFLGGWPRKPWILGKTQINSSVRADLGSSSTLPAVTTSRCFRGKWEDLSQPFPSHSFSHLLTMLIAVFQNACDFSGFGSCGWLNIAVAPMWGSWVSCSTSVGDAHLGNNLPPAIYVLCRRQSHEESSPPSLGFLHKLSCKKIVSQAAASQLTTNSHDHSVPPGLPEKLANLLLSHCIWQQLINQPTVAGIPFEDRSLQLLFRVKYECRWGGPWGKQPAMDAAVGSGSNGRSQTHIQGLRQTSSRRAVVSQLCKVELSSPLIVLSQVCVW